MKPITPKTGITTRLSWQAVVLCASIPVFLLYTGCQPGIIAVLGTPTSSEAGSAEYKLSADKDQKILVFVDQPAYLSDYPNLRFYITDIIYKMLEEKAKIKNTLLIEYSTLADFRVNTPDFAMLSPAQIGEKLGANLVLAVTVTDCKVSNIPQDNFVTGTLDAHAALYRVSSGEKLWPTNEQSRLVQVGFESERRGRDAAIVRLAAAASHCITRYLYNCSKAGFKISDERTASGW